jgi:hypothetical protein
MERKSKYKSEASLRIEWRVWNENCHPEDQIDWIEFYEEVLTTQGRRKVNLKPNSNV